MKERGRREAFYYLLKTSEHNQLHAWLFGNFRSFGCILKRNFIAPRGDNRTSKIVTSDFRVGTVHRMNGDAFEGRP